MTTLNKLDINDSATIKQLTGDDDTCHKLRELGIIEGCKVHIVRKAPFGDPIVLNVKGCELAIRKKDLEKIIVEPLRQQRHRRRHRHGKIGAGR